MIAKETWIAGILFYKGESFTRDELEVEPRLTLREAARLLGISDDIQERAFLTSSLALPFECPRSLPELVGDAVEAGVNFNDFKEE